jgi:hypothetical protein
MSIDDFKNFVEENDMKGIANLINKGLNPSFEKNWAINTAYKKGFYDMVSYLATLQQVRKKLLDYNTCLTQQQINHLTNYPTPLEEEEDILSEEDEEEEEEEEEYEDDDWLADDDEIEYEEGYDPTKDHVQQDWDDDDWRGMMNKLKAGDEALKELLQRR